MVELEKILDLLEKAINQAKTVVSVNCYIEDRLVSIHGPKARPIRKGKAISRYNLAENLLLTGNEQGFITSYKVYQSNPNNKTLFQEGIQEHHYNIGTKAKEVATERDFYSSPNEMLAQNEGIRVAMPKC
jgi:hypothetical protein